jgi:hypothetical protein
LRGFRRGLADFDGGAVVASGDFGPELQHHEGDGQPENDGLGKIGQDLTQIHVHGPMTMSGC